MNGIDTPAGTRPPGRWPIAWEGTFVGIAAAGFAIAWALRIGPEINVDFLVYHLYIGLHAGGKSLATNYFPAGISSYLLPYAHWPLSAMIAAEWPPSLIGAVWAVPQSFAALAAWMVALRLIPQPTASAAALRVMGVVLAMLSPLVLAAIGSSHVDLLTAIPVVVGLALMMRSMESTRSRVGWLLLSGACFGAATALKLTNATAALAAGLTLFLLMLIRREVRMVDVLSLAAGGMIAGFIVYGYWGYLLWLEFGNPVFPFFDPALKMRTAGAAATLAPTEPLLGAVERLWTFRDGLHQRFLPRGWSEWLLRPLYLIDTAQNVYVEVAAPDARFLFLFLLAPIALLLGPNRAVRRGGSPNVRDGSTRLAFVALVIFIGIGWLIWMLLFGNGRYMLPITLAAGPALVECSRRCLRNQTSWLVTALLTLISLQTLLMFEASRFGWSPAASHEKWINASLPDSVVRRPTTFILTSTSPPSWLTLFVHPQSRFVSPDVTSIRIRDPRIAGRISRLLSEAPSLTAVFPYAMVDIATGLPVPPTPNSFRPLAERHGIFVDYDACETGRLRDERVAAAPISMQLPNGTALRREGGLFFCPARHDPSLTAPPVDVVTETAFNNLERACPQQMPARTTETVCAIDVCLRHYPTSDVTLTIQRGGGATMARYGAFDRPYLGEAVDLARSASDVDCHEQLGRYAPFDPARNVLSRRVSPPSATR